VTRWLWPETLEEAIELRASLGDEALAVAGGTFVGVLAQTGFLDLPETVIALGRVHGLASIEQDGDSLAIGAMATHAAIERDELVRSGWSALAECFGEVANVRVRSVATIGGVLADADYASDPPSMLLALGARVELASPGGIRVLGVDELILGHYDTAIEPDELIVRVRIPRPRAAAYVKFRSRSSEDRPCVAVAAARLANGEERVAVGAVSDRPLLIGEIAGAQLISDLRGSADYRRRMVDVHARRALAMLDE
jgi:aerobic carbon-monoxide dehydrogenase medium subunit